MFFYCLLNFWEMWRFCRSQVIMVGTNCCAIASGRRLGVNFQTIATNFQRIFKIHEQLYIGLSGLAIDVETMLAAFREDARSGCKLVF